MGKDRVERNLGLRHFVYREMVVCLCVCLLKVDEWQLIEKEQ